MIDVSVIGCGNMGGALITGLSQAGGYKITAYDVDPNAFERIEAYADRTTTDLDDVRDSEVVVIAVKPDIVPLVLDDLELTADQTLVTIAAGVSKAVVEAETEATVVRIMPNLAARTRNMAAAVAWDAPDEHVEQMLSDLGSFVVIDEDLMDVATALNGSGPAFVFYLIGAMQQRAVDEGMDAEKARVLAAQTFKGAAETVLRSDESIEDLIDAVCSPGGTTIEGMEVLWDSDVEDVVGDALSAAARRSAELAEEAEK
ncbi:pyrroline-5-carboxylate reductase [Halobellus captivus]|uniref:pyrroline-5-carboxylate reductase n=1 Tax=Halobellus captivus TaxID=2592614 RepID=UPI0011A3C6EF|nr:pyrroline-5-carboxylate reductase [Halobellus captivus]